MKPIHNKEMTQMKKSLIVAMLTGMVAAPAVLADANLDLAQKSGCLACHAVDHKVVGPAYKDVAKKYAGDKGAEAKLVAKVKAGGSGVWGAIPMPPNAQVSDADVKKLVHWVLSLK
jgi:cytochrome c